MANNMNKPEKKYTKVKVWWLRKGGSGFLPRDLWMNGANARLAARGKHFGDTQSHEGKSEYKVIPCIVLIPKKAKR